MQKYNKKLVKIFNKNRQENINEFSKKVIGILKVNNFNVIVKKANDNYTVVQDFNELYDTTYNYKPLTNPHHNHEIKKFHDHDHIIVHKESLDKDGCSKIEGYTEGITEEGIYAEQTTYLSSVVDIDNIRAFESIILRFDKQTTIGIYITSAENGYSSGAKARAESSDCHLLLTSFQ
ncbi:10791_t:CDS:2, partial [Gigaspora margarita]